MALWGFSQKAHEISYLKSIAPLHMQPEVLNKIASISDEPGKSQPCLPAPTLNVVDATVLHGTDPSACTSACQGISMLSRNYMKGDNGDEGVWRSRSSSQDGANE